MNWKNIFNSSHKTWGYISLAVAAAKQAGYPMVCWNDRVYAISEDGTVNLGQPLCLAKDLE